MEIAELSENYFEVNVAKDNLTIGVDFDKNTKFDFIATKFIPNKSKENTEDTDLPRPQFSKKLIISGHGSHTEPAMLKVVKGASSIYNPDMIKFVLNLHHTFEAFFASNVIKQFMTSQRNDKKLYQLQAKKDNALKVANEADKKIKKLSE